MRTSRKVVRTSRKSSRKRSVFFVISGLAQKSPHRRFQVKHVFPCHEECGEGLVTNCKPVSFLLAQETFRICHQNSITFFMARKDSNFHPSPITSGIAGVQHLRLWLADSSISLLQRKRGKICHKRVQEVAIRRIPVSLLMSPPLLSLKSWGPERPLLFHEVILFVFVPKYSYTLQDRTIKF